MNKYTLAIQLMDIYTLEIEVGEVRTILQGLVAPGQHQEAVELDDSSFGN